MEKQAAKQMVLEAIDRRHDALVQFGRTLYGMPETGFREFRSSGFACEQLRVLGLSVETGIAITGFRAKAQGRSHDRCVAVMGELDALLLPSHLHADPATGAAHACGHHAQIVMLLGAAVGLVESGVMEWLDGDVAFLGVPAEEAMEPEFRAELVRQGKLEFPVGKQECIRLGMFSDVDAVIGGHVADMGEGGWLRFGSSYNGIMNKLVLFHGRSSHAALSPELGINALQAAVNAINNINALRATLPEAEHPRIHYILSKGGDSCNIIPDEVVMELGVRAASLPYLQKLDHMVDDAVRMGAASVGARAEIRNLSAYLPTRQDGNMGELFRKNAEALVGADHVVDAREWHKGSSTDVGAVSAIRPVVYFNFSGSKGAPHTADVDIQDEDFAYVGAAKAAAMTVVDLLWDGGAALDRIKAEYRPDFSDVAAFTEFHRALLGN